MLTLEGNVISPMPSLSGLTHTKFGPNSWLLQTINCDVVIGFPVLLSNILILIILFICACDGWHGSIVQIKRDSIPVILIIPIFLSLVVHHLLHVHIDFSAAFFVFWMPITPLAM